MCAGVSQNYPLESQVEAPHFRCKPFQGGSKIPQSALCLLRNTHGACSARNQFDLYGSAYRTQHEKSGSAWHQSFRVGRENVAQLWGWLAGRKFESLEVWV